MWQEWYKDGKVYTFEMSFPIYNEKIKAIDKDVHGYYINDGYMPVFDMRLTHVPLRGRNGSVILENDIEVPETMLGFQKFLSTRNGFNSIHTQLTNLNPSHVEGLRKMLDEERVQNILMDSLFENQQQFKHLVINVFADYVKKTFFAHSHGRLLKRINEELEHNMDAYPVRNPYYANFNELTFVLMKNNIFEIEYDVNEKPAFATQIIYDTPSNRVSYGTKFKFMVGPYETDDSALEPPKSKSQKW